MGHFVELAVNGVGEFVDTFQISDGVQNVDRQAIVIADDTTYAARSKVQNADPAAADYGLTVRVIYPAMICYHTIAAASNNAANIKASAGWWHVISVFNNAGYPVFVKLYNKATTPAPASDTPIRTFGVQAGMQRDIVIPGGVAFSTGLGIAIVKGIADNDNTSVAASDCAVDVCYR